MQGSPACLYTVNPVFVKARSNRPFVIICGLSKAHNYFGATMTTQRADCKTKCSLLSFQVVNATLFTRLCFLNDGVPCPA